MHIFSFSPFGYKGNLVCVEVDLRRGIPAIDMVGLADGAVKESRERMRSAIRNSGLEFPSERVLISLSPADLKKEGAGFDLAIALAVLDAKLNLDKEPSLQEEDKDILIIGELDLSGNVKGIRGVQAAIASAKEAGIQYCIVPYDNKEEAKLINGMKVFAAHKLIDAFNALETENNFEEVIIAENKDESITFSPITEENDISIVKNQRELIRALQIAAAGGHNVMAFGAPGCGKTLAIQRFGCLLPNLTQAEAQITTRIYSIAGLLPPGASLMKSPPFRVPHQTASLEGIFGGGPRCTPGEVSLAHNGVLFLDEAFQYKSSILQMLRTPLGDRTIMLSRAGISTVYPANFQLLLATNPCPCGNFGSKDKICLCSAKSIEQYWKKFSAPLLDRIDIRVHVDHPDYNQEYTPDIEELRREIEKATSIQRKRQGKKNNALTPAEITQYCITDANAKSVLDSATERYNFSPRAVSSCLKLSRTIADMKEKEVITQEEMQEAIKYRKIEGGLNDDIECLM